MKKVIIAVGLSLASLMSVSAFAADAVKTAPEKPAVAAKKDVKVAEHKEVKKHHKHVRKAEHKKAEVKADAKKAVSDKK